MRIRNLAIAATVAVLGIPVLANAAPAAPSPTQTGIATLPEFQPVRDGCGRGFYLAQWRDRWGRWQRRCVPLRGGPGPWRGPRWGGPGWGYYR